MPRNGGSGLTLQQYAEHCQVPAEFLRKTFDLCDHPLGGVELPYGYGLPVKRRLRRSP